MTALETVLLNMGIVLTWTWTPTMNDRYIYIPNVAVIWWDWGIDQAGWMIWKRCELMMDILEIMKTNPGIPNGGNVFFSSPTQQHPQPSPPLPFHQDLLNLHHIYFRHGSKRDWTCSPRFFVGKEWNSRNTSANWTKIRMASCDLDALGYVTVTRPRHVSRKSGISSGRENGDFILF